MIYVFIDTNVFLNFYSFTKDHLDKLENLIDLIKKGNMKLILPQQVIDEVNRNRENKLKETLNSLKDFQMKLPSPATCHGMKEMEEIQKMINKLRDSSKSLEKQLIKQIKNKSLPADKLIYEIFSINEILEISDNLLNKARRRITLGNPPGKDGSSGDAINWECILENVPDKNDLYFICGDKDYASNINNNEFSEFLSDEWKSKKKSKVILFNLISQFLQDKFPKIKMSKTDIEEEQTAIKNSTLSRLHETMASIDASVQRAMQQSMASIDPIAALQRAMQQCAAFNSSALQRLMQQSMASIDPIALQRALVAYKKKLESPKKSEPGQE